MSEATTTGLNKGLVIDMRVDEAIAVCPEEKGAAIVLTVESKSGRKARIRVQSTSAVKVSRLDGGRMVPIG